MVNENEDVHVNNVGSGALDGTGIGPRGEPGVYLKKRKLASPNSNAVLKRASIQRFKEFVKFHRKTTN